MWVLQRLFLRGRHIIKQVLCDTRKNNKKSDPSYFANSTSHVKNPKPAKSSSWTIFIYCSHGNFLKLSWYPSNRVIIHWCTVQILSQCTCFSCLHRFVWEEMNLVWVSTYISYIVFTTLERQESSNANFFLQTSKHIFGNPHTFAIIFLYLTNIVRQKPMQFA